MVFSILSNLSLCCHFGKLHDLVLKKTPSACIRLDGVSHITPFSSVQVLFPSMIEIICQGASLALVSSGSVSMVLLPAQGILLQLFALPFLMFFE